MTRQEREKLWNGRGSWSKETQDIFDSTYNKFYWQEIYAYPDSSDLYDSPMHRNTEALLRATEEAENAVNEYLTKTTEVI